MNIQGKHIAVLKGGPGSEREVSMASAASVVEALAERGAIVSEIDVRDEHFEIGKEVDLGFNVIHGTFGEDGQLQKILNARGIPYTGAGARSSETAFDKVLSKKRFIEHSVPTPLFEIALLGGDAEPAIQLDLPIVIKPPKEGSSVGVSIVKEPEQVGPAFEECAKYDQVAMIEEFVEGKETDGGCS